jgi:hypothetical protein
MLLLRARIQEGLSFTFDLSSYPLRTSTNSIRGLDVNKGSSSFISVRECCFVPSSGQPYRDCGGVLTPQTPYVHKSFPHHYQPLVKSLVLSLVPLLRHWQPVSARLCRAVNPHPLLIHTTHNFAATDAAIQTSIHKHGVQVPRAHSINTTVPMM